MTPEQKKASATRDTRLDAMTTKELAAEIERIYNDKNDCDEDVWDLAMRLAHRVIHA